MENLQAKYARVKAIRNGKFVEFDFSVNDADLSLELIMPFSAFEEFCKAQNASVSFPDGLSVLRASPPATAVAGLYRRPAEYPDG